MCHEPPTACAVVGAGSAVVDVPAAAAVVPEAPACVELPAVPASFVELLLPYACASHLRCCVSGSVCL